MAELEEPERIFVASTDPESNTIGKRKSSKNKNNNNHGKTTTFSDFGSASDEEFRKVCKERLSEHPLCEEYPELFDKAACAFVAWRKRYATRDPKLWNRLFSLDRVLKEFIEAAPVLHAVVEMIDQDDSCGNGDNKKSYTIIDLCSGKGFLGMLLSEMLPPSKVFRIVLMDKAWPMRNSEAKDGHINWEHIYGTYNDAPDDDESKTDDDITDRPLVCQEVDSSSSLKPPSSSSKSSSSKSYYDTWPIPMDTSKQDLKSSRQLLQIKKHYLSNPQEHPVIILAIHLCGILSLRAIDLFNDNPAVGFLALKPCCLPGMIHAKRHEVFRVGNHCFPAEEVCVHGKWNKNKWQKGPPRSHLEPKFKKWSRHLYRGLGYRNEDDERETAENVTEEQSETAAAASSSDDSNLTNSNDSEAKKQKAAKEGLFRKVHTRVGVQHEGGFQNDFLFVERLPVATTSVWKDFEKHAVKCRNIE